MPVPVSTGRSGLGLQLGPRDGRNELGEEAGEIQPKKLIFQSAENQTDGDVPVEKVAVSPSNDPGLSPACLLYTSPSPRDS